MLVVVIAVAVAVVVAEEEIVLLVVVVVTLVVVVVVVVVVRFADFLQICPLAEPKLESTRGCGGVPRRQTAYLYVFAKLL